MTAHTWINALNGAWQNLYVPTQADMNALDLALSKIVNGDGGGMWAPAADMNVGGAGVVLMGLSTLESGAAVVTTSGKPIVHGDNDYTLLGSGHLGTGRTLRTPMTRAVSRSGFGNLFASPSAAALVGLVSAAPGARAVLPLRVHNGATLLSATLTFRVAFAHASVPATLPGFRVCSVDLLGNVTPLTGIGTDQYGFVAPATPASGADWFDTGAAQTLVYTSAGAGPVVDRSQYSYFAELVDESGAGSLAGNVYTDVSLLFYRIEDCRPS